MCTYYTLKSEENSVFLEIILQHDNMTDIILMPAGYHMFQ